MRKKRHLKENLVTALEIPQDLAYQEAIVTMFGSGLVVVENYRSILRYTTDEILLLTAHGKVRICGKRLEIPCYTSEEMQICGCISGIFLER